MKKFLLSLCTILAPVFLFAQQAEEKGVAEKINEGFKPIADAWGSFVFYPVNLGGGVQMPIVIIMLLSAGLLFTILFKFVNIILFPTSINIVRGKYDDVDHATSDIMAGDPTPSGDAVETIRVEGEGEVSHFQALTAALSGTVGLGNIAGDWYGLDDATVIVPVWENMTEFTIQQHKQAGYKFIDRPENGLGKIINVRKGFLYK